MNWEAVGAVGEILGGLAVFITVIYMALQLRQIKSDLKLNSVLGVNQLFNGISNAAMVSPDWVCEILSPSTAKMDRADKLPTYARHSVRHVWLVDPLQRTLE